METLHRTEALSIGQSMSVHIDKLDHEITTAPGQEYVVQ